MYEHAGASCLLSVAIVAVFAVLLHEKEPAPPPGAAAGVGGKADLAGPEAPARALPPAAPSTAATEDPAIRPASPAVVANLAPAPPSPSPVAAEPPAAPPSGPSPGRTDIASAKVRVVSEHREAPPRPRKAPRPAVATRAPRSSFAEAGPGEGLVDVATRVYGTPDAVGKLWRANRDRIARPGDPVAAGTWLRTP